MSQRVSKNINSEKRILKDKPVYIQAGSQEETQYLTELKSHIAAADMSYMDYKARVND